ncbi:MAG TPA: DsbA family protein [Hyphomicrobiaceae bacterium]|nr:DsbA family protein [Hyphomicrobiaceae bacterium]
MPRHAPLRACRARHVAQVCVGGMLLVLGVLLSGCGSAGLSGIGVTQPGDATAATPDSRFNPFSDDPTPDSGRREVIQNPTLAEVMQPGPLPEMSLGRADAPVTIIKYASMTCPYCRKFQMEVFPELKRQYIDTGKVRFIIREFPIGLQSGVATIALRCAPANQYFTLYDRLMREQPSWVSQQVRTEPIFKVASQVGMTRAQFDACRQNQGMIQALNAIKERGRTLGVIGTPNFFINGKLYKSVLGLKEMRDIIDPILAGRVAAAADPT